MPGTILRNTTGPFVSQPFLIPPGHSLALSLAGTSFSATLEGTLDADSTDWVQIGVAFSSPVLFSAPVGAIKYRLNIASGTVVSAQYSSSTPQMQGVFGLGAGVTEARALEITQRARNATVTVLTPEEFGAPNDFDPTYAYSLGIGSATWIGYMASKNASLAHAQMIQVIKSLKSSRVHA